MSTLAEITQTDLKSISCDASVKEAATRMRDEKISSLLVEKNHDLVGIITDTDVVRRAVAEGKDLTRMSVQTIMTSPIATIESMRAKKYRMPSQFSHRWP